MLEQLDLLREQHGTAALVVWAAFAVGMFFGAVAEYSRYCARSALAEWAPGPARATAASATGYVRTKQYLAAVVVALLGTQALFFSQNIDLAQSIYWSVGIQPLALVVGVCCSALAWCWPAAASAACWFWQPLAMAARSSR
jgi:hypothetical protein